VLAAGGGRQLVGHGNSSSYIGLMAEAGGTLRRSRGGCRGSSSSGCGGSALISLWRR
jgi:hypothetical protein